MKLSASEIPPLVIKYKENQASGAINALFLRPIRTSYRSFTMATALSSMFGRHQSSALAFILSARALSPMSHRQAGMAGTYRGRKRFSR